MSYTEYLRRKAAGSPVIIDRRTNTDASMYTMRQRHLASSVFFTSDRVGAVNNTVDVNTSPQKAVRSYTKATGRVPDASSFTSHSAAWQLPLVEGKITLDPCCVPTLGPAPKSASDFTREAINCCTQPHVDTELGPSRFVDNTIRLKHLVGCCDNEITKANHEHPVITPFASWSPRPDKGAGGIPVYSVASPSDARKVGDFNPRKIPYVEKHHGNDLNVNPRRVPGPFRLNTGIPHLKINDPFPRGCEGCGRTSDQPSACQSCQNPQTYTPNISALPANEVPVEVSPYNQEVTPCVGDVINLEFTSTTTNVYDFNIQLPELSTVIYLINDNNPTSVSPTGTGPYNYSLNDITLNENDLITIRVTVTNCGVDSILFRYLIQP